MILINDLQMTSEPQIGKVRHVGERLIFIVKLNLNGLNSNFSPLSPQLRDQPMKRITLFFLLSIAHFSANCQTQHNKGELSTTSLVNVDVMYVLPEKKSGITVIFRAETPEGEPVWNLKKEELIVREDSVTCPILSIEPISKNRPISTGVVIDHSGSMAFDLSNIFEILLNKFLGKKDTLFVSPLENAKKASAIFVSSFNSKKDFMSLVGFGSEVDLKIPLSQDTAYINKEIKAIEISGSTALYDAMMAGIKQLKKAHGIKVLVALTDGHENASKSTWQNVVDYAKETNTPIYIVGLGAVEQDTLTRMAKETKGQFYYTKKSENLLTIYQSISKQIQSYYALEYTSANAKKITSADSIKITFDANSIYLANDSTDPDVIAYLKKKEFDRQLRFYGKVAVGVLVGGGAITLMYTIRRRRRERKLQKQE
jgi:Ca-activated chloride channel family protein